MARVDLGRVVGYSAYEIAVQNGYEGTEQQWLASLKGETGSQGPAGPAGQDGTNGTNGQDGADGTTFTPSVSAEGIISWTNDGGKANPQSVNIKGPQGETGATGPAGTYTAGTGITISNDVISATQELPAMTSSDVGKVLKVNSTYDGVEWGTDASVSYTAGDNIDITSNVISVQAPIQFESTSGNVASSTELQVGGLVLASEDDTDPNDPVNTELMLYPNTVYFTAYGENKALRMDEDGDIAFDNNKLALADDIPDVLKEINSNPDDVGNAVCGAWGFGREVTTALSGSLDENCEYTNDQNDPELSGYDLPLYWYINGDILQLDYDGESGGVSTWTDGDNTAEVSYDTVSGDFIEFSLVADSNAFSEGDNFVIKTESINPIPDEYLPEAELPEIQSGDAGKVLTVNSGETGVEWAAASGGGTEIKKIFMYGASIGNLSADDNVYLTNLYHNGFDKYPCYIDLDGTQFIFNTKYSNSLRFINVINNKYMSFILASPNTAVTNITSNIDLITGSNINIGAAAQVVGGGQTLTSNLRAIKDGYATKAELPSYTNGTGLNLSNSQFSIDTTWLAEFVDDIVTPKPFLNTLQLSYEDNGDTVYLINLTSQNIKGVVQSSGYYYWDIPNFTISETIDNTINYARSFAFTRAGQQYGDGGGSMFSWDSQGWWVSESGPIIIYFNATNSTDTTGELEVVYDPNWQPPTSVLSTFVIQDSTRTSTYYNGTNLGISDNQGTYTITNVDLGVTLADNDELNISYAITNGPSSNDCSVTLTLDSGNLVGDLNDGMNSPVTFMPVSGTVYNINFQIGGQN